MSVLGDRWAFALLVAAFVGVTRFTDFQSQLGAPPATIADRLSVFTAERILVSTDGRYRLTEKGRAFFPVLVTALHWAQQWFPDDDGPAVILTHTGCGRGFTPFSSATSARGRCAAPTWRTSAESEGVVAVRHWRKVVGKSSEWSWHSPYREC